MAAGELGPAIWLKLDPQDPNNHMLLSHGDLLITEDKRFSVLYHDSDNVYVLKVSPPKRNGEREGKGVRAEEGGSEG